ncbi:MAG: hypothetical protein F4Z16_06555 [Rhodothermaceae bacterium]|nr:hypothetical protein [Rhodothermaceae bacterium]MYD66855.1 hypothetical protein [Rhodothermaceae bacterium]MYI78149.1 hypothetical protein [Gammaproteobacteria bacterium]
MSIPVHTRLANLQGIYPRLRAIRAGTSNRLEDVRTHLMGAGGANQVSDLSASVTKVHAPSDILEDGDLLVDRESRVLLQVSRVPYRTGDVHARILEPHPQRVHQSEAFIDELGAWLSKPSAPSRTNMETER